jgi:hypothetical protein
MPSIDELIQYLVRQQQILPVEEYQQLLAEARVAVNICQHAIHMKVELYRDMLNSIK